MIIFHALLSSTWKSEHTQWYISWPDIPCNLHLLLDDDHPAHCQAPTDLPLYPCLWIWNFSRNYFFCSCLLSVLCFVHDLKASSIHSCWKSNFDSSFFCYPPLKIGQHLKCNSTWYLILRNLCYDFHQILSLTSPTLNSPDSLVKSMLRSKMLTPHISQLPPP